MAAATTTSSSSAASIKFDPTRNRFELHKPRYQWKLVNNRNPKSYVIQPAKPGSAKQDLARFMAKHDMHYVHRNHGELDPSLAEFEFMFDQLELDTDEDLLERAERRDIPASLQQRLFHKSSPDLSKNGSKLTRQDLKMFNIQTTNQNIKRTVPNRRSAMPNVILDDLAFRKFNRNSGMLKRPNSPYSHEEGGKYDRFKKHLTPSMSDNQTSYMPLVTVDSKLPKTFTCRFCQEAFAHPEHEQCPLYKFDKCPDLVADDLLNRKLRQSSGNRVASPQPPFGIPNSIFICYVRPNVPDYVNASPGQSASKQQRSRFNENDPDLVSDDMAFRSLRK